MQRRPVNKMFAMLPLLVLVLCGMAGPAVASEVRAGLSARETWVGMPVTLQISIQNAEDWSQPQLPDVDGCDVRSAGAPAQSSQVTIINGRRSESRSITMNYLITPRHEGAFEIPSIAVEIDGQKYFT
ncbi:MAG: BatD family protein, partial [Pirellulaceae bacterium]